VLVSKLLRSGVGYLDKDEFWGTADGGRWRQMTAINWFYARVERECDQRIKERSNSVNRIFSARSARVVVFSSPVFLGLSTDSDKEKRPRNFRKVKFSWLKR